MQVCGCRAGRCGHIGRHPFGVEHDTGSLVFLSIDSISVPYSIAHTDAFLEAAPFVDTTSTRVFHPQAFLLSVGILTLAFTGLAVSVLPFVVVDSLTVWEAAASYEALTAIAWGAVIVLPAIIADTRFVYWLFRGKPDDLAYP